MKQIAALSCIILSVYAVPAAAVNRCTGQDGKVTYQQAVCPTSAKDVKIISAPANGQTNAAQGVWKFKRSLDEMTGQAACFVVSPITSPMKPIPKGFYPVHAMLVVDGAGGTVFGIRTSSDEKLFHNDLAGVGIKTDVGEFMPLTVKSGSHVVGLGSSVQVLEQLDKAQSLQMRLRFWPYEQLYDFSPLSMAGYGAALAQAKSCAATLKK